MRVNLALQLLIFFGLEILKILTKMEGDINSGKGVKLALWLAPSTSKPKTTVNIVNNLKDVMPTLDHMKQ